MHQTKDDGFIIFAETASHGGDVSGNNSWPGNSDIWMVKINSNGELIWQECFGGSGNERIYGGVLKKSDYNWVIAGRADNNSFDVSCNLHGFKEDYWVFEIKDTSTNVIGQVVSESGIKVYPNPVGDYVVFEFSAHTIIDKIGIFDYFGRKLNTPTIYFMHNKIIWDTRTIQSGIYFCSFEMDGKIVKKKVVVKK